MSSRARVLLACSPLLLLAGPWHKSARSRSLASALPVCDLSCCCYDQPYACLTTSACYRLGYACSSCAVSSSQCASGRRRSTALCSYRYRPTACPCTNGVAKETTTCTSARANGEESPDNCDHCFTGHKLVAGQCIETTCEDFLTTLDFNRSLSQGCGASNWTWCRQLAMAPFRAHEQECCASNEQCSLLKKLEDGVKTLYSLNLADMLLEIAALVIATCGVLGLFAFDDSEEDNRVVRCGFAGLMSLMFVADLILQIFTLKLAMELEPEVSSLISHNCLDIISGREQDLALIGLQNDLQNMMVLGWIELAFAAIAGLADCMEPCTKEGKVRRLVMILMVFGDTLLAIVDFAVLTASANSEMAAIFDSIKAGGSEWCTIPKRSAAQLNGTASVVSAAHASAPVTFPLIGLLCLLALLKHRAA